MDFLGRKSQSKANQSTKCGLGIRGKPYETSSNAETDDVRSDCKFKFHIGLHAIFSICLCSARVRPYVNTS